MCVSVALEYTDKRARAAVSCKPNLSDLVYICLIFTRTQGVEAAAMVILNENHHQTRIVLNINTD